MGKQIWQVTSQLSEGPELSLCTLKLHTLWITKDRKEEDETRSDGGGWAAEGYRGESQHETGELKAQSISKQVHKKLVKNSWPLGGAGVGSRLRAWFQVGPSHQPVWARSREPDIYILLQMCPNSRPALPRCWRGGIIAPRPSSPGRAR